MAIVMCVRLYIRNTLENTLHTRLNTRLRSCTYFEYMDVWCGPSCGGLAVWWFVFPTEREREYIVLWMVRTCAQNQFTPHHPRKLSDTQQQQQQQQQ